LNCSSKIQLAITVARSLIAFCGLFAAVGHAQSVAEWTVPGTGTRNLVTFATWEKNQPIFAPLQPLPNFRKDTLLSVSQATKGNDFRVIVVSMEKDRVRFADQEGLLIEEPVGDAVHGEPNQQLPLLGGLAVWKERAILTLPQRNGIWLADLSKKSITAKQSLPDFPSPTGIAFDSKGTPWVLSGNSLTELTFTSDGHFNPIHHRGDFDHPRYLCISKTGHFYVGEATEPPTLKVLSADRTRIRSLPLARKSPLVAILQTQDLRVIAVQADGTVSRLPDAP
jgi:hypothetical protein